MKTLNTITHKGFEFEYSYRQSTMQCDGGQYYIFVRAPKHGLLMGSVKYFSATKPTEKRILNAFISEANWHIKNKNVK